jgi:hypothetical protein
VTALVAQALKRLEAELATRGKEELFKGLQPFLREGVALPTQENVAANLGMPIDTLRSHLSRMRARYRDILREELRPRDAGDVPNRSAKIEGIHTG